MHDKCCSISSAGVYAVVCSETVFVKGWNEKKINRPNPTNEEINFIRSGFEAKVGRKSKSHKMAQINIFWQEGDNKPVNHRSPFSLHEKNKKMDLMHPLQREKIYLPDLCLLLDLLRVRNFLSGSRLNCAQIEMAYNVSQFVISFAVITYL